MGVDFALRASRFSYPAILAWDLDFPCKRIPFLLDGFECGL